MKTFSDWLSLLTSQGARMGNNGAVLDFGNQAAELRSLQSDAAITPLTEAGIISVFGEDAQTFLNTQLTSDVLQITPGISQYSGYCTPKGRLLATFVILLHDGKYLLILPREVAEAVATRLQRYVMRSRVKVELNSELYALVGITGTGSAAVVNKSLGVAPLALMGVVQKNGLSVIALPRDRQLIISGLEEIEQTWRSISKISTPAGANAWTLQGIRSGIASVTAATQEAFIPQMLALETFGGVSFEKGCYPGQEIVARTQYLGNLKRRLYVGRSEHVLFPGDAIVDGVSGKSVGTVTDAASTADGNCEFLAVLQREALESAEKLTSAPGHSVVVERPVANIFA